MNRFDQIHSIIDAVFGPDDDGPVPGVRAMIVPLDVTRCAGCGIDLAPGAIFHLCGDCHWQDIEEAVSEQSPMHHALGLGPDASCAVKTPLSP